MCVSPLARSSVFNLFLSHADMQLTNYTWKIILQLSVVFLFWFRAWAQLGGDIDLQDESSGTSLSDSIEKWNGVSDTKFLDEELKVQVHLKSSALYPDQQCVVPHVYFSDTWSS